MPYAVVLTHAQSIRFLCGLDRLSGGHGDGRGEDPPEVVAVQHRTEFLRIRLTGDREEIGQGPAQRTRHGRQLLPATNPGDTKPGCRVDSRVSDGGRQPGTSTAAPLTRSAARSASARSARLKG